MARQALVFEAERSGYSIGQLYSAMTVGELRSILENYDDDTLFVLSHDRGYTYGSIFESDLALYAEDEAGEWDETY